MLRPHDGVQQGSLLCAALQGNAQAIRCKNLADAPVRPFEIMREAGLPVFEQLHLCFIVLYKSCNKVEVTYES